MSNVIDLDFVRKNKEELKKKGVDPFTKVAASGDSFEETAKKNKENEERVRKERLNANKSVLRSYRMRSAYDKKD